jgi:transposase
MYVRHQELPVLPLWDINPINPEQQVFRRGQKGVRFDYLDLPDMIAEEDPRYGKCTIEVIASQVKVPTYPQCPCLDLAVKSHTPFPQRILDVPQGRKQRHIQLKRRRWKCKGCGATITQPLSFMAEEHNMTQRLLEYVQVQSFFRTDLNVAEETGVSVRRVRTIRKGFAAHLKDTVHFETPRVLGMDGVRADGRRRIIFTDLEAHLVVDLIKSGRKKSIRDRLEAFPDPSQIRFVLIDMCRTERDAVRLALPHAVIIIDLFHVVRMANQVMNAVRNRLYPRTRCKREPGQPLRPRPEPFRQRRGASSAEAQRHREYWFSLQPELELAYDLKEDFLEIMDAKTYGEVRLCKTAARRRYEEWQERFPANEENAKLLKDFKKIFTAMKNWGDLIFNYFDHGFTNAFTESMNRRIKDVWRETRGCSFETARERAIYGTYLRKQMMEDREREVSLIKPPSKRRRPTSAVVKERPAFGAGRESGQYDEMPELIQCAFNFTN